MRKEIPAKIEITWDKCKCEINANHAHSTLELKVNAIYAGYTSNFDLCSKCSSWLESELSDVAEKGSEGVDTELEVKIRNHMLAIHCADHSADKSDLMGYPFEDFFKLIDELLAVSKRATNAGG